MKNLKILTVRSDRGTEFTNQSLSKFLENNGTIHEFSEARTPQQNGIAERRNRTLKEASRTMLANSNISQRFWVEVVTTVCYTQNWSIINKKHSRTPYEIWTGKRPAVSYFKIFVANVLYITMTKII